MSIVVQYFVDKLTCIWADRLYRTLLHLSTSQEDLQASAIEAAASLEHTLAASAHQPVQAHVYPRVSSSPPFPFTMKAPALVIAEERSSVDIYTRSAVGLSYSRTLELLRRQLGPHFDLEKLWEKHTYYVRLSRVPRARTSLTLLPGIRRKRRAEYAPDFSEDRDLPISSF